MCGRDLRRKDGTKTPLCHNESHTGVAQCRAFCLSKPELKECSVLQPDFSQAPVKYHGLLENWQPVLKISEVNIHPVLKVINTVASTTTGRVECPVAS